MVHLTHNTYLDRSLVRLDLANRIKLLYFVPCFNKPFDDLALGDALGITLTLLNGCLE